MFCTVKLITAMDDKMKKALLVAGCFTVVLGSVFPACAATSPDGERVPKALVIMLDGMRADTVDNGLAPNIKALADGKWQPCYHGAWSLSANTLRDGTS